MAEQTKNTIVVLEPSAKSATELLKLLEEKAVASIVRVNTPDEAFQNIVANLPCIFLTSINDNQEVPACIQLFKRLETSIKHHGLKVYVVTPIKNRQLSDMITQKMGVTDYIIEPVPVRTMQFKANLQLKAVDNFRRQQEMKKAAEEKIVIKKLEGKRADGTPVNDVKSSSAPALEAESDTFLFKNSGVKKAGKKFTVELEGPDPSTGEWVEHEDKGDAKTAWRWVPNEEKEAQAQGAAPKDGWVHKGDKPVFNENSQKWAMTSEDPSLALEQNGKTVAEKITTNEAGEVVVAEDSPAAEENLKRNRQKVKKKKKEGGLAAAEALLNDAAEEPEAVMDAAAEKAADPKAPPHKIGDLSAESPKSAALKSLLDEKAAEGAGATEVNDKRDPSAKAPPPAMKDKRGPAEEAAAWNDQQKQEEEKKAEAPPKADKSPLAFLQKKKEEKKLAEAAKESAAPAEAKTGEESEELDPAKAPRQKKRKKDSTADALARLNDKLNAGEGEDAEESAATLGTEASGEEEAEVDELGHPKIKLGKGKQKQPAALREDPADQKGELNDRQSEGAEKAQTLRRERNRTAADIKALLESPLPETLSAEEEDEIREELGLKDKPEITAKDLVRRKRLKNAKELKDRMAELNAALEQAEDKGEAAGAISAGAPAEEVTRNEGDLSREKLKGIRAAIDSEEAPAEADEEMRKRLKESKEEKAKSNKFLDKAEYMPEAELVPLGNAWERADTHYVYLDATVRVRGFNKIDDLLPLWVFEGEDIPKLLDKTKQWRFLGGRPLHAKTVAEVPSTVREFLLGLREQVRKAEDKTQNEEEKARPGEEERAGAEDVKGKTSDEAGAERASAEEPKRKKKSPGERDMPSLGKSLDDLLGEEKNGGAESPAEEHGANSPEDGERASPEEAASKKSKDKDKEKDDPMARLRAKLGAADEDAEKEERVRDDQEESSSSGKDRAEEDAPEKRDFAAEDAENDAARAKNKAAADEEERAAKKTGLENLANDLAKRREALDNLADGKSEGVQKFLERRKKKLAESLSADPAPAATEAKTEETKAAESAAKNPPPGYLGIYVALSDAYANVSDPTVALGRVLGAIEGSLKNCVAYVTSVPDSEGKAEVLHYSREAGAPGAKVALGAGLAEVVKTGDGANAEILGYLFLGAQGERQRFDEAEEAVFRRLAKKLWPLINRGQARKVA